MQDDAFPAAGLDGQTAVIIGGTSGIGLATARLAAARGARVVVGSRNPEKVDRAVAAIGPAATGHRVDAGSSESLEEFFAAVGALHHLFVPAADYRTGRIGDLTIEEAESPFRAKFWLQYRAVKAALPHLEPTGSVVLMSGAASARPAAPAAAYVAANSAVEGLGRGLAMELAPVRVNTVSPGTVDGALWRSRPDDVREAAYAGYARSSLLGRVAAEEEIAHAVVFLMTNTFTTGSTLYTDGGYTYR
ncbi:SDR family oxidoreductase [Pseudonocardia zijingensis]|jgi:NAD(P)-dependent dehydrogenase (short-subunit alcohol dehydrogenase family)|uniref:SDR family oxidoreductase n=1 Tax=Pseudonocardia zijingensis TaxID=153376 RepID=A0ABP3ZKC5_9PSEU